MTTGFFENSIIAAEAAWAAPSVVTSQANSEALETISMTTAEPTDESIRIFFSLAMFSSL